MPNFENDGSVIPPSGEVEGRRSAVASNGLVDVFPPSRGDVSGTIEPPPVINQESSTKTQAELDQERGAQMLATAGSAIAGAAERVVGGAQELVKPGMELAGKAKEGIKGLWNRAKTGFMKGVGAINSIPSKLGAFALRTLGASERIPKQTAETVRSKSEEMKGKVKGIWELFSTKTANAYNTCIDTIKSGVEKVNSDIEVARLDREYFKDIRNSMNGLANLDSGKMAAQLRAGAKEELAMAYATNNDEAISAALEKAKNVEDGLDANLEKARMMYEDNKARLTARWQELRNKAKGVTETATEDAKSATGSETLQQAA